VNWTGKIRLVPEALDEPLHWRRPERVFVNSMSDLFHPDVPDEFIDQVFAVMMLAPQHTFMVLTKRPERMAKYFRLYNRDEKIGHEAMYLYEQFGGRGDCSLAAGLIYGPGKISNLPHIPPHPEAWPLPNVWLGVSVENQRAADERIPLLLQTPAAVRFLSCEPLLGPVDLTPYLEPYVRTKHDGSRRGTVWADPGIDWVIVGGESGPGARPMHPDWVRGIRDQCVGAGVAFFFKQWGEWVPFEHRGNGFCVAQAAISDLHWKQESVWLDDAERIGAIRVGKKAAGRLLDGRTWDEFPNNT
jgi:protein gp37